MSLGVVVERLLVVLVLLSLGRRSPTFVTTAFVSPIVTLPTDSAASSRLQYQQRDDNELVVVAATSIPASSLSLSSSCGTTKITSNVTTVPGPSVDSAPDYASMVGPLGKGFDNLLLSIFRNKLAKQVGIDSKRNQTDYQAIVELALAMNSRYSNKEEIQKRSENVLQEMFPFGLPRIYSFLFSKPFPAFASRLNAWVTTIGAVWLMGECEITDVEIDPPPTNNNNNNNNNNTTIVIGKQQGVLVKRCKFLEESRCASVCMNSCKLPTQKFFNNEMNIPTTITPNYDTFECVFAFGKTPDPEEERQLLITTPCLQGCPTSGKLRTWHNSPPTNNNNSNNSSKQRNPKNPDNIEDFK